MLVFPGESGKADEAMIDSTFQILRLESMFPERSLIPSDAALAFLNSLIEDYADEWLTKSRRHRLRDDLRRAGLKSKDRAYTGRSISKYDTEIRLERRTSSARKV